jgi:hypothetical protein
VTFAGGTVLADRGYFPYDSAASGANSPHRRLVLRAAAIESVGRAYYEHYAMLAELTTISAWDHPYYRPA